MPTTTNYGWTTPADTDLVKDGASAIRTLGTAIDTTTYNNAQAAIAKTIVDAKGDLIVATAADTVARLAVGGTNGHVLQVDSSTASGLKWDAVSAGGMTLLSTTTLSGSSTTISSISSSYTDLRIVGIGISLSATDDIFYRFNGVTTSSYGNLRNRLIGTTVSGGADTGATSSFFAATGTGTSYEQVCNFVTDIPRYSIAELHPIYTTSKGYLSSTSSTAFFHVAGMANISSAISSITILTGSATFSSGTIYLYGVS